MKLVGFFLLVVSIIVSWNLLSEQEGEKDETASIMSFEQSNNTFTSSSSDVLIEKPIGYNSAGVEERFCTDIDGGECATDNNGRELTPETQSINIDSLAFQSVMSLEEQKVASDYWNGLLKGEPDEVWNTLSAQPLLLKTFSHSNIRLLFSVFSNDLLYSDILDVHNLEQLPFEHQSHIVELMFDLDSEFTSYEITTWPYDYEVRNSSLLQIPESWKNRGSTGVEFMEFVYQVRDDQLNRLMADSFYSYEFRDIKEQLDWIAANDSQGIFIENVPELMVNLSKTLPQDEFLDYAYTSPFTEQAREIISELEQ